MRDSNPSQFRFCPIAGFAVRADFEGGVISSDFGALLLRGVDHQTGRVDRLAGAIRDRRHASYIEHSLDDLLRQRIVQAACGYADGNDANTPQWDPGFKLAVGRAPLDTDNDLASGPTFSRLENAMRRSDIYRLARAFVEASIASYAEPPAAIVLDRDHCEDRTHGQQELAFYNHHYGSHGYLPLFLFEGLSGKLVTAVLRPSRRPTGRENAAFIGRVLRRLRQVWPDTHIVLRGDAHFANPERLYRDLYCARGQDENVITAVKNDLASDRTAAHGFFANHLRLFYACAAYDLIHRLRDNTLCHTERAKAQPMTLILKRFKLAVRICQYKDRIKRHLPVRSRTCSIGSPNGSISPERRHPPDIHARASKRTRSGTSGG
jgi:hypothetical protein